MGRPDAGPGEPRTIETVGVFDNVSDMEQAAAALLAGAFIAKALSDRKARDLVGQLARGGLVLWVRTADAARQARAYDVLSRHSAHHVRVHTVPRPG